MGGGLAGIIDELRELPRLDGAAGRAEIEAEYALVRRGLAWFQGREAELAGRLATLTPLAEDALADLSKRSRRDVDRVLGRASTAEQVPALGAALIGGDVSGEHVDTVTRALAATEPSQRTVLAERVGKLVELARHSTVDEFERRVRTEVRSLNAEAGLSRLDQQRRDRRVRTWVDRASGMWHLHASLDPETGVKIHSRLRDLTGTLFNEREPDDCPSDAKEKQDYLRALAFVALTEGKGARPGLPEVTVVWDITEPAGQLAPPPRNNDRTGEGARGSSVHAATARGALGAAAPGRVPGEPPASATGSGACHASEAHPPPQGTRPRVDWGIPVELPLDLLEQLYPNAETYPVVLRGGLILYAPGRLDLGRTTRLANRAQRRALRALYPTCAMPGCDVSFEHCKLHHVVWWRHGGGTDLHNLLPVCLRHHQAIHLLGWQLTLTADRILTIRYTDGTVASTGPPHRRAA